MIDMEYFITPEEVKKKIDMKDNIMILDVREPSEYTGWHIAGSANIPIGNLMHDIEKLPKNKDIVTG